VLGSTGSIGTQALDVVRRNPDRFRVVGLAAGGSNVELLAEQAIEFNVEIVSVSRATAAQELQLAFYSHAKESGYPHGGVTLPRIEAGPDATTRVAQHPCDVVLNGMTGSVGLAPTLAALETGRILALANKESLIVGGPLVKRAAKPGQIVPVDSEHSALAQALRAGTHAQVRRLVLTASGGPFRGRTRDELANVTPEQALAHPTWSMGPMVTTNSATLMNKGLEVIEAHLLFHIPYDRIDVVVHPQSVVHSMVEFIDGSTIAQASPPDMRLPIALGMAWPDRVPHEGYGCDWTTATAWSFEPVDHENFPALRLAETAGRAGGTAPAVFNAANEVAVEAFLTGHLPFLEIVPTIAQVLQMHLGDSLSEDEGARHVDGNAVSLADVFNADAWARRTAHVTIDKISPA